ncbi:hypothetical protein ABW19_dt0205407 [Dactylella cylindrospora]|nr:hypothetical protein ABW19_dt0205407 [Dactylella cylindrospora]
MSDPNVNPDVDQDAALQQYIWVNSNTPGGWGPDPEPPVAEPTKPSEPSGSTFSSFEQSASSTTASPSQSQSQSTEEEIPKRRRRRVKQCRICFDSSTDDTPDPELGRLISPCLCKGSSKYVHEECLRAWRLHSANSQSFYKCPTCHFEYKFRRLKAAQIIASTALQVAITSVILFVAVYILGFVADPIINLYVNPWYAVDGANFSFTLNGFTVYGPSVNPRVPRTEAIPNDEPIGFIEHMVRGLSALGLIGFAKVLLFSHHWVRYIFGGPNVGRRGRDGRDRIGNLSWIIIIWGVINFLIFVWGYVRNWTKGILDKIAIGVADIGTPDDDYVEDEGVKEE